MEGLNLGFAIDLIDKASFKANKIKGSFNELLASITKTKSGMKEAGEGTKFFGIIVDKTRHQIDALRTKLLGLDATGARLNSTFHRFRGILAAIGLVGFGALISKELKSIYAEGERLETQVTQLETTLKSKAEAFEMLAWAQREAVKTPFEIPEINDAIVMLKAYNLDAKKYFTLIGNMAAGMGQSLDAAVYAFARATLGNYEAIERFGINKRFVHEKATEMFGAGTASVLSGAQVTIKDYDKFLQALIAIMNERFEGGMLRLSKTMTGIKSNIADFIGNVKRQIIGLPVEGTLFTQIKNTYQSVLDFLQRNEAQFTALAKTIAGALKIVWSYVDKFIQSLINWGETWLRTTFDVSNGVDNTVYPLLTKMEIIRIKVEKVLSAFGSGFVTGFSAVMNVLKTVLGPFWELISGITGLDKSKTEGWANFAQILGTILGVLVAIKLVQFGLTILMWIGSISRLIPLVKALGSALMWLVANPVGLVITAIGILIGGLILGIDKLGGLRATIDLYKRSLMTTWVYIEWFGKSVWKVFENLGKIAMNWGIVLSNVFATVWELLKDIGGRLLKFVAGSVKVFTSLLSGDFEGVKSALAEGFGALFGDWGATFNKLKDKLTEGTFTIDWNFGWEDAKKKADETWNYFSLLRDKHKAEYEKEKELHGGGIWGTLNALGADIDKEYERNWKPILSPESAQAVVKSSDVYQFNQGAIVIQIPGFDVSQVDTLADKLYESIKRKAREEKTR